MSIEIMNLQRQTEVTYFLSQVHEVLSKEGGKNFLRPGNREKNRKDLSDLGITLYQVREIIHHLTHENYYKGPTVDFTTDGSITYEFGTEFDGNEIYIKLEVIDKFKWLICKCISFHKAERPIDYPLKGGEEK